MSDEIRTEHRERVVRTVDYNTGDSAPDELDADQVCLNLDVQPRPQGYTEDGSAGGTRELRVDVVGSIPGYSIGRLGIQCPFLVQDISVLERHYSPRRCVAGVYGQAPREEIPVGDWDRVGPRGSRDRHVDRFLARKRMCVVTERDIWTASVAAERIGGFHNISTRIHYASESSP